MIKRAFCLIAKRAWAMSRYINAIHVRAERAAIKPVKDADKALHKDDFNGWEAYVPRAWHEAFR